MSMFDNLRNVHVVTGATPKNTEIMRQLKNAVLQGMNSLFDTSQPAATRDSAPDPTPQDNEADGRRLLDEMMRVYPEPGHHEYEDEEKNDNVGLQALWAYGTREDIANVYEQPLMPYVFEFDTVENAKAYVQKRIMNRQTRVEYDPAQRPIYTLPEDGDEMIYRRGNIVLSTLGNIDQREYENLSRELRKIATWTA